MSDKYSPQEALQHYFDDLLAGEENPVTRYADPDLVQQQKLEKLLQSARPQVVAPPEPVPIAPVAEIQEWEIEPSPTEPAISAALDIVPEHTDPDVSSGSPEESHYTVEELTWAENGRPQWAQKDFDVLLFQVSGLTLAVPLIALGQIQPLTDELTPLFGQADWFMGLLPTPAGKIRTVNTAKFVMPERYDENFLKTAKYVISIDGVPWGLAVDSVNQPITLKPTDVKWRSERTKRPWLAGTVKDHMCALLDIPMIGQLLIDADRNSTKGRRSIRAH
ncbi:chemotaxis protein CheW [Cellvibrio sp. PSBB006]|uniref:chemotaxis protein CheW n=1 Tax=Cellvibrio sp. PSBB006 TaxID=1987723 RepID=UPI000B3B51C2|nr:chemotaxis protein CheW [Cellvibrio sp. PSBB006]ARU26819.1 flagellar hook-basal body complex protein FliE [Cellvibrio sp. PSBB006]